MVINAPSVIFDPINTVIAVKTTGKIEVTSNMPALQNGNILLPADFADIHNPGYGTHALLEGSGAESVIKNWTDPRTRIEWMFNITETGKYRVEALINTNDSCRLNVNIGNNNLESKIPGTNQKFEIISLGEIEITETGNRIIALNPIQENWKQTSIMYVELIKM
jgi:alpha-L-fucosidase